MKLSIPSGTTSKRIAIFIQDSSSTTGAGLTGLTNASSSLVCYSWIDTDGNVAGTAQALQSATRGTWTTRGFIEKDATNMPGFYEFGVPDALLAAGVKWAVVLFKGATNMAPLPLEIEVTAVSNQDAVRGGMTALPNANAEAAGGLYTRGTGAGQIRQDANGRVDANAKAWIDGTIPAVNVTGVPKVDLVDWLGAAPNALISARVDANAQVIANAAIASATFAASAIDAAAIATDAITSAELAQSAADKILATACTEPTAIPAASPTALAALSFLLTLARNKITQTATTQLLRNDADGATIATYAVSDDGTTFSRSKGT